MAPAEAIQVLQDAPADPPDVDGLLPLLYHQLKVQARRALRGERLDHTLSPTALVHEAYVRLSALKQISWRDRAHFMGAAAQVMRRILISYARAHNAAKRGGPRTTRTEIEDIIAFARNRPDELLELDAALDRLAALSPRQARVVECRFFAEMSLEETAEVLSISSATVKREWTIARAWLNREMIG
ncbi:MAG TPA: ECF-type sigma factor [Myxococcaceae bacterium]|nr:ECF-type sigma factor [Myxococcaceae bacterium]